VLLDLGIDVIVRRRKKQVSTWTKETDEVFRENHYASYYTDAQIGTVEFLDPSPSPEPVANENGLLPCPICGGKSILQQGPMSYNVACERAYCVTFQMWRTDSKSTIEAWNRRAGKEANP